MGLPVRILLSGWRGPVWVDRGINWITLVEQEAVQVREAILRLG